MNNRLLVNNRGTALVEIAIVIPLLVMLVFGITELGRALYQLNTLAKAAETGARYLARANGVIDVVHDPSSGIALSCAPGAAWGEATTAVTNVVVYGNEDGGVDPILPGITVSFEPLPHVPPTIADEDGVTTTGCIISVTVSAGFVSAFGGETLIPFTTISPITLSEAVQERFIGE
jgi:hypothetical protein